MYITSGVPAIVILSRRRHSIGLRQPKLILVCVTVEGKISCAVVALDA